MNLRQLVCFLAVAEEGSFTRGAERVGIAQPSLSQQIRGLETELGGLLIERLPRGIALTPAGRAFLPEARAAATVRSVAIGILPTSLQRWHERNPGISVRLHEYRHRRLLEEDVRRGVGDVAVGPRPASWNGPLVSLGHERFVIVLSQTDELAGRKSVRLGELADREWVLFEPGFGLAEVVAAACGRAGFQPRASVRTAQSEAAARLAAAGLGPALVPDNIVPPG